MKKKDTSWLKSRLKKKDEAARAKLFGHLIAPYIIAEARNDPPAVPEGYPAAKELGDMDYHQLVRVRDEMLIPFMEAHPSLRIYHAESMDRVFEYLEKEGSR